MDSISNNYIDHIKQSLESADINKSKIDNEVIQMDGMSGIKTRHFYNNLLTMNDSRYLEIGTWKGSSVCSAMCMNNATVVCIDNWSEFGGPKETFLNNFNNYKGHNNATFIEADCFKLDISTLPKFNIYMYDGPHEENHHYMALTHYYNCLDDIFIFIVDDWNWKKVRDGTRNAINKLKLLVLYEYEKNTTADNTHPIIGSTEQREWHNGIYVSVLKKSN